MPETIENYVPLSARGKLRKQAIIIWGVLSFLVFAWLFLILLAPITADSLTSVSTRIYSFFSYLCHQNSERSFHVLEQAFAVCSRCFGVYLGLFSGFLIYPLLRRFEETDPLPRFWLYLAMVPMVIDWLLGVFGIWENTHLSRFLTGTILGAACAIFIIPALIEIFQLLLGRRKVKRLPI